MLSKKTKYAINALVFLAKQEPKKPILIETIAKTEHIPKKFLENILLELNRAGIVASKKGKGGGYYLRKTPENIHMAELMRLFDGPIALLPCVSYVHYERCEECVDEVTCGIRKVFLEIRNKTVELLKQATLQVIIKQELHIS